MSSYLLIINVNIYVDKLIDTNTYIFTYLFYKSSFIGPFLSQSTIFSMNICTHIHTHIEKKVSLCSSD